MPLAEGERLETRHALAAVLSLSGPTEPVSEGQQAAFTLKLSEPSKLPQRVTVTTTPGGATYGVDYFAPLKQTVLFAPGQTSQTVSVSVLKDAIAEAKETFTLVVKADDPRLGSRSHTVAIVDADPAGASKFQITFNYDSSVTEQAKQIFKWAGDRISKIITGDLPDVRYENKTIDDFQLNVRLEDMESGLNGYAMTLQSRTGPKGLPFLGEAAINASKIGNPGIKYTIVHEIVHALGFNQTFWSQEAYKLFGGTQANPQYLGANAIREYNALFGGQATGVPLADSGGPGTYGSHWRTSVFGTEILSVGWDTTRTDLRPFSRITVGVLQDLGYKVNYLAADPYSKPLDSVGNASGRSGAQAGSGLTEDGHPARAAASRPAPPRVTPAAAPSNASGGIKTPPAAAPVRTAAASQTFAQRGPVGVRKPVGVPQPKSQAFVGLSKTTLSGL